MIRQLDMVALTRDVAESHLVAGDVGAVVMIHDGGAAYEVEFVTLSGETLAVLTLPGDSVRPLRRREIPHVREVA